MREPQNKKTSQSLSHLTALVCVCIHPGKEPEPASGAGDPQTNSEPERAEDAEPAGVSAPLFRETAQTGAQPHAGHEAGPGQTEPGATQVKHR